MAGDQPSSVGGVRRELELINAQVELGMVQLATASATFREALDLELMVKGSSQAGELERVWPEGPGTVSYNRPLADSRAFRIHRAVALVVPPVLCPNYRINDSGGDYGRTTD